MLGGMALAFAFALRRLPPSLSLGDAAAVAGALGRMKVIDFAPRLDTRYTFWSGITGGLFVALAYFGTDQSQVQRYLTGGSLAESRRGLLMNGLVKVPMQFLILAVGAMVFVFYQFQPPPLFWNGAETARIEASAAAPAWHDLERRWGDALAQKRAAVETFTAARHAGDDTALAGARDALRTADAATRTIRTEAKALVGRALPRGETQDADYIFLRFVTAHFPAGLVGLLIAVILCAAMSATAAALNALGTTSVVDFYRASWRPDADDAHYLRAARLFTALWGLLAVGFAAFTSLFENLIQAVNILGSLFYGPTLGVFLIGFFTRRVRGDAVFLALIAGQAAVLATYALSGIGYLWYNVIGCAAVLALAPLFEAASRLRRPA
jgi:Na+/proline symporter